MMEFWPDYQGQTPLYKFGTLPGRNCAHNYHDRHQATHYPFYYGEHQDQGRESSYWTLPGSRTGGAPQDYTNWTDQELSVPTSSHFPFILDTQTSQHHDLGEYQPHEARGREWSAAQRAAREYERGFLREGWQRRWEPCSPTRYNREVSIKRSDSSYRELEAWAARYSHSLPRRRRIEAELRGASQCLLESSRAPERDIRSGIDRQVAALQQARQSANIRESGVWDRGGRQQTPTYYLPQAPVPEPSHMLDIKEKTGYQRRMFSQPPGYIAPPPYNSPHKSSSVIQHCDTSWGQEGKRQTYWSQPPLRKQDLSVDLQDKRKGEKEDLTKPNGNRTCAELGGLNHRGLETDALQAGTPISVHNAHMQHGCMLSLQHPQTIQAVQSAKKDEQTSSKVIEGRKFRLNKKTGGLTIFCLVSRIAGTTETPSLPLCTSQTIVQSTELGEISKGPRDSSDTYQTQKLADEVDFRAPALIEQSKTSDSRNLKSNQTEMLTCIASETLGENLSNKAEICAVSSEKNNLYDENSTFGRQGAQSVQPVSVKYPLWREPSFTSRAETESSSTAFETNGEEGESEGPRNEGECATVDPINVEVSEQDIRKDTHSPDSKGLLVIDTTCVVVKMELIPSPKKEHVHFLDSTPHTEDSPFDIQSNPNPESNSQLNQDVMPNAEAKLLEINDEPETELESDLWEKKATEGGGDISFPCMPSSAISEKETLEERAERILGIPLHDCVIEQHRKDATSFLDLCVEKLDKEVESSLISNDIHEAVEQLPEDTTEEERSQNNLEFDQTENARHLKESDDAEDQVKNEAGEHFAGPQEQMSEEKDTDSQLETNIKTSIETEMAKDDLHEPTSEEDRTEQSQGENPPVENDIPSQHPSQCFSPPQDLSSSSLLSHSNLPTCSYITEGGLDTHLASLDTAVNLASHPKTSSPLPPGSNESSPSSTPHIHHSPSPPLPPLDLVDQTAEAMHGTEDQNEAGLTLQLLNNEISDTFADPDDQEVVSQHQFEYEKPHNAAYAESNGTDEQQTKEATRDPTDLLEQILEISTKNALDVNILQQQLEGVQPEDVACVKESYITEEQLQQEANGDPANLPEMTISQGNVIESQTPVEVKILPESDNGQEEGTSNVKESLMTEQSPKEASGLPVQTSEISKQNAAHSNVEVQILLQQFYYGQEEDASHVKDSCVTEEQSQISANEDPADLLEETIAEENATECQTEIEIEILQDTIPQTVPCDSPSPSPSDLDCEVSQSSLVVLSTSERPSPSHVSYKSDTEPLSLLEMGSVCPLALNPVNADVDIPQTVPLLLHLDSCEDSPQYSSSSTSELDPNLAPSTSTPPHEGGEGVSLDLPRKEEPQYPKSLWDAVNRIRKHTAPDSENEEEEASEMWDPDSIGEDLVGPDVVLNMKSERIVFDEAGERKVLTESAEDVGQDRCHERPRGLAEEDTLSCSSTSSRSSGDTVIIAEEDKIEATPLDAMTESKTDTDEEFPKAEGERCCSSEVKDETVAKEVGEDERDEEDIKEFRLSKECTVQVEGMTVDAMEMMETEQKLK